MHWLGDPQLTYPCIQVAGTNGKSSTARFTAAFLHSQGFKVGLYTSPDLVEYPERMEIDGVVVSRERFAQAVFRAHEATQEAVAAGKMWGTTEFELLTAAALWLFADEQVDFAVLEVGLGGRWDATSVVSPAVAVITGVGLDHMDILGDTIEEIASEKAAIIKPGCVPVLGVGTAETREVFLARCTEVGVEPVFVGQLRDGAYVGQVRDGAWCPIFYDHMPFSNEDVKNGTPSPVPHLSHISPVPQLSHPLVPRFPSYQKQNIACALAATKAALRVDLNVAAIQHVLDTLTIPGRFELLRKSPPLLIDASHNPQSATVLAEALIESCGLNTATGHLNDYDTLLLGVLSDKDAKGIVAALAPLFDNLVVTQSSSPRAIPADELAKVVHQVDSCRDVEVFATVSQALEELTKRGASVVATGSITLAGDIKRHLMAC